MDKSHHSPITRMRKRAPILLIVVVIAEIFIHRSELSVQRVLAYTPDDPLRAALVLLLLYALKSVSIIFPGIILQIAGGCLFPRSTALTVNFLGMLICLAIPYGVGALSGSEFIEWVKRRFPKFRDWLSLQQENSFFVCFFLHVTSCLPGDVVGMYFGATRTPFVRYMVAGSLGVLPGMVLATLLGESISDPTSPLFLFSISVTVVLSVLSALLYYWYLRKKKRGSVQ